MAECAYCKTETFLYYSGVPVCIKCAEVHEAKRKPPSPDRHVRTTLFQEFVEATTRVNAASEAFIAVMGDVPRLNDFLAQGIIPEDLKQGSGG
jgi:hypothetical protein